MNHTYENPFGRARLYSYCGYSRVYSPCLQKRPRKVIQGHRKCHVRSTY